MESDGRLLETFPKCRLLLMLIEEGLSAIQRRNRPMCKSKVVMAQERVEQTTQHQQDQGANLRAMANRQMPVAHNTPNSARHCRWMLKTTAR